MPEENTKPIEENKSKMKTPKIRKTLIRSSEGQYHINTVLFWIVVPIVTTATFTLGTIKFDKEKIEMTEERKQLEIKISLMENNWDEDHIPLTVDSTLRWLRKEDSLDRLKNKSK